MQLGIKAIFVLLFCYLDSSVLLASAEDKPVSVGAVRLIRRFEGFRASVYEDCAGHSTIGYGHLITASEGVLAAKVLSEDEAQALLVKDIQTKADISRYVHVGLSQNQTDALTSLCFNIGYGNFSGSTVLKKVNAGETIEAYEYFGHWRRAGGKIFPGLIKRRFAELFVFADQALDPADDKLPSIQWGLEPMKITDENWLSLRADLRNEAVKIYENYTLD